jgi:hypothetical protein
MAPTARSARSRPNRRSRGRTTRQARRPPRRGAHSEATARKHSVRAALSVPELTKARTSLKLEIFEGGEKIGELEIGRGGFFWRRGKGKKSRHFSWERVIDRMDD